LGVGRLMLYNIKMEINKREDQPSNFENAALREILKDLIGLL
jgi:hypothetical protein